MQITNYKQYNISIVYLKDIDKNKIEYLTSEEYGDRLINWYLITEVDNPYILIIWEL